MNFDKEYTKYWTSAVSKSVDGTIIAGVKEAKHVLKYLQIKNASKTLDLGCSVGRMYEALAIYSDTVYGLDIDSYAVEKARSHAYKDVRVGTAEEISFDVDFFDLVFCWAVFDVVDHKKGLAEINRVLKNGGKLLFTGKNDNYFEDDVLAYKAEKNAFLKGFPNRFTDLKSVLECLPSFGFELDALLLFPRRGDFGKLGFVDQGIEELESYHGYEYIMLCHKIGQHNSSNLANVTLENQFSKTVKTAARKAGYEQANDFFESIGFD
jgi:SAM-dependent methyltransferase